MTGTRLIYRPDRMEKAFQRGSLIAAIRKAGLTGSLQVCLDAGDATSVTASSATSWVDISGINTFDFFRGTTSGADATDPTFNGTVGRLSSGEYWSFDGGDLFTYDSANEAWMNRLHQDSALWSVFAWVWFGSVATLQFILGTGSAGQTGATLGVTAAAVPRLVVRGAAGATVLAVSGATTITGGVWNCYCFAIDEAANTLRWNINSATESSAATYATPSAGNATQTMQIGAAGNAASPLVSGSRLAAIAVWEGKALSLGEMRAIFELTRGKFSV